MTDLIRSESRGLSFAVRRARSDNGKSLFLSARSGVIALGAVAALGTAGSAYCGFEFYKYSQIAATEQAAARRAESANAELQTGIAKLRDRLGAVQQSLNSTQNNIAAISDNARDRQSQIEQQLAVTEQAASAHSERIAQLARALDQAQRDLRLGEAQNATLLARLSKAEADLADEKARQAQAQAGLDQSQKKYQQLASEYDRAANERDKSVSERDQLRARLSDLERRLSMLQTRPNAKPVAANGSEAMPQPHPPARVAAAPAPSLPAPSAAAAPAPVVAALPAAPAAAPTPAPAAPATIPATAAAAPPAAPLPAPPAPVQVAAVPAAAPALVAPAPAPAAPAPVQVAAVPAPAPAPVAAAPAPRAVPAVVTPNARGVAQFERVLASAGVDVRSLFAQFGVSRGEGGPFIPLPHGGVSAPTTNPERLAALVKALPITAPLQNYDIGSPFGVRGDPINGRASYHTGLDLRAPYGTPVFATAPGVVTYAGYRDDYGRIVEIDHGHGITTRYAHLNRATVSVGQRVAGHAQIGFLGSSGRATGPHVHYEVLVNGEPQDPAKFLGLARILPVISGRS